MVLIVSIILIFVVISATVFRKFNVPLIIISLTLGIVFGSGVTGFVHFSDSILTQKIANIALIFVLFAGGFGIDKETFRPVLAPVITLSTVGVLLTAFITSLAFYFVSGWPYQYSLLLAAIISSTDAAAVFSILRSRSINKRVASITEIESAANDPMAIVFSTLLIQLIVGYNMGVFSTLLNFLWQLSGGVIIGLIVGKAGSFLFRRIRALNFGYYYILLLAIVLFSYSITDLVGASGMLAAFFSGFVLGNSKIPNKQGVASFTDAFSFIANVALFILLGLLVEPSALSGVWFLGLVVFLIITLVARPVTVFLCTIASKLSMKDKTFISWSGMRGAVPIVLATYPIANGIDPNGEIFNIVFVAVTISIVVQGTTIGRLADKLSLSKKETPPSQHKMELVTLNETSYELFELFIDLEKYEGRCKISDLDLPQSSIITMITRDAHIIAPRGNGYILPGDILTMLTKNKNIDLISEQILSQFDLK